MVTAIRGRRESDYLQKRNGSRAQMGAEKRAISNGLVVKTKRHVCGQLSTRCQRVRRRRIAASVMSKIYILPSLSYS